MACVIKRDLAGRGFVHIKFLPEQLEYWNGMITADRRSMELFAV